MACKDLHLVKTALSFLVSTVSRMVSLPAPVVMVSVVTVSLDVDSVLPSSSSLSELLEEELSDATNGAFLATQTLHTQAVEIERKETVCKSDALRPCYLKCLPHDHKGKQLTNSDKWAI